MKRILMLAWEYPPRIIGGLARVVYFLSREMVKNGCEVHVITADGDGLPAYEIDEAGVHVHRVETLSWPNPGFVVWDSRLNFATLKEAIGLDRKEPFDIVHAHDWLVADAALLLKELGLPLISTIHATEFGRGIDSVDGHYIDRIDRELVHGSMKVIVNSRHMLDEVSEHFQLSRDNITVIPNGIDPDKVKRIPAGEFLKKKYQVDGPVVLFVGRLVREKGVQVLLKAAPRILKRHPNVRFIIAGSGYFRDELESLSDSLGVSQHVTFFGQANDNDLTELYSLASVLAIPSLYEPFGIVALEGMACGLPVVASDAGGLADIFDSGHDGILTQTGNASSLAGGILNVLGNPSISARLGKAARKKVLSSYTWEAISERTLAEYESALKP